MRARLAFTWNPENEFKAGIRWTTGDRKLVLEPGDRRGSPLSYQDLGDVFDKLELNLDRVFISYMPQQLTNNTRKAGEWKAYYSWNRVEQESVLTPVAQDDWLRATNFEGQWLGLDYYYRKNVELRFWVLTDTPILPVDSQGQVDLVNGRREQEWRGRVDLTVYF